MIQSITPGSRCINRMRGSFVFAGMGFLGKDLEIRSRRIHYRGPLIIVASQRVDPEAYVRVQAQLVATGIMRQAFFNDHCGTPLCGKAVAVFHVADCRPMTDDDHQRAFVSRSFERQANTLGSRARSPHWIHLTAQVRKGFPVSRETAWTLRSRCRQREQNVTPNGKNWPRRKTKRDAIAGNDSRSISPSS